MRIRNVPSNKKFKVLASVTRFLAQCGDNFDTATCMPNPDPIQLFAPHGGVLRREIAGQCSIDAICFVLMSSILFQGEWHRLCSHIPSPMWGPWYSRGCVAHLLPILRNTASVCSLKGKLWEVLQPVFEFAFVCVFTVVLSGVFAPFVPARVVVIWC